MRSRGRVRPALSLQGLRYAGGELEFASLRVSEAEAALAGYLAEGREILARAGEEEASIDDPTLPDAVVKDACSFLYGACAREARRRGFERIITYTLASESGASVKAAGFRRAAVTAGGSWDTPSRRRTDSAPTGPKQRWELTFARNARAAPGGQLSLLTVRG